MRPSGTIDLLPFSGLVSQDNKVLTLFSVTPTVETVSFPNGDIWPRICHRSRVLIWMGQ